MFQIGICDMCGSETRLYKAEIEGTVLNVCRRCAKFGKVLASVHDNKFIEKIQKKKQKIEHKKSSLISDKQITEALVENYHEIIKKKREELNLKQEDFAKKINEKVSLIHKIETGTFEPNMILARKIERFLRVKLIEQIAEDSQLSQSTESESFTLGDFIKVRKRE